MKVINATELRLISLRPTLSMFKAHEVIYHGLVLNSSVSKEAVVVKDNGVKDLSFLHWINTLYIHSNKFLHYLF